MLLLAQRIIIVPAACIVGFCWLAARLSRVSSRQMRSTAIGGLVDLDGVIRYSLSGLGREDPE